MPCIWLSCNALVSCPGFAPAAAANSIVRKKPAASVFVPDATAKRQRLSDTPAVTAIKKQWKSVEEAMQYSLHNVFIYFFIANLTWLFTCCVQIRFNYLLSASSPENSNFRSAMLDQLQVADCTAAELAAAFHQVAQSKIKNGKRQEKYGKAEYV